MMKRIETVISSSDTEAAVAGTVENKKSKKGGPVEKKRILLDSLMFPSLSEEEIKERIIPVLPKLHTTDVELPALDPASKGILDSIRRSSFKETEQEDLIKILSNATGKNLLAYSRRPGSEYKKGMILIPTKNPNSNSYEIGRPVLITEDNTDIGLKEDKTVGNHLPSLPDQGSSLRDAKIEDNIPMWMVIFAEILSSPKTS